MAMEKRKERRIKVSLPIKIIQPKNFEIASRTENISRLGAYAKVNRHIPAGTDVEVILKIPAYTKDISLTGEAKCKANIFRCNPAKESAGKKYYGLGIFFTDFPKAADREKLFKYIDYLLSEERKNIREGIRLWRKKRNLPRNGKPAPAGLDYPGYQQETLRLLKEIAKRLEEISRLLQNPASSR